MEFCQGRDVKAQRLRSAVGFLFLQISAQEPRGRCRHCLCERRNVGAQCGSSFDPDGSYGYLVFGVEQFVAEGPKKLLLILL